jgi:hypothetical protein
LSSPSRSVEIFNASLVRFHLAGAAAGAVFRVFAEGGRFRLVAGEPVERLLVGLRLTVREAARILLVL